MIPFLILAALALWFLTRAQQTPATPTSGTAVSNAPAAIVLQPIVAPSTVAPVVSPVVSTAQAATVAQPVIARSTFAPVITKFFVDTGGDDEFTLKNPEPVAVGLSNLGGVHNMMRGIVSPYGGVGGRGAGVGVV